jgi:hypothetical protein
VPDLNPAFLRLAAVRRAKRRQVNHHAEIDHLMRKFATLADHMREHGYGDEARLPSCS